MHSGRLVQCLDCTATSAGLTKQQVQGSPRATKPQILQYPAVLAIVPQKTSSTMQGAWQSPWRMWCSHAWKSTKDEFVVSLDGYNFGKVLMPTCMAQVMWP